jgi:hypothetical protein
MTEHNITSLTSLIDNPSPLYQIPNQLEKLYRGQVLHFFYIDMPNVVLASVAASFYDAYK